MTQTLYNQLFEKQGGVCAVCGLLPSTKKLILDHDRSTGNIRGLLCTGCSINVGGLERLNQKGLLQNAYSYLGQEPKDLPTIPLDRVDPPALPNIKLKHDLISQELLQLSSEMLMKDAIKQLSTKYGKSERTLWRYLSSYTQLID